MTDHRVRGALEVDRPNTGSFLRVGSQQFILLPQLVLKSGRIQIDGGGKVPWQVKSSDEALNTTNSFLRTLYVNHYQRFAGI